MEDRFADYIGLGYVAIGAGIAIVWWHKRKTHHWTDLLYALSLVIVWLPFLVGGELRFRKPTD